MLHGRAEILNFSLSVEKYFINERSKQVKYFQHEKRNFVPPSGHIMFYLLYKYQWNTKPFQWNSFSCERRDLLCSYSNHDIFTCENNMLFSHVKISCFRAKAHLVFHWCLYNNVLLPTLRQHLDQTNLVTEHPIFPFLSASTIIRFFDNCSWIRITFSVPFAIK